jgi:hypothetical protein
VANGGHRCTPSPGRCCWSAGTPRPAPTCCSGPSRWTWTALRLGCTDLSGVNVGPGAVVPLRLRRATQLDIVAEFALAKRCMRRGQRRGRRRRPLQAAARAAAPAAERGALGPFGLLGLADASQGGGCARTGATTRFARREPTPYSSLHVVRRLP